MKTRFLPLLLLALGAACPKTSDLPKNQPAPLAYPPAPRGDVLDDYSGTQVADPYRWLEDPDSPETRAWIDAENALTRSWIDGSGVRDPIRARLEKLWDFEKYDVPFRKGDHYFYLHNDGLQNQSALFVLEAMDGAPRLLLDPNTLSADGTMALSGYTVSEDGRFLAYGISDAGSDWTTWKVRDVATGQDMADELHWIKFSDAAWTPDGKGFYYGRFPEPANPLEDVSLNNKLYYHRLGSPQTEDLLVYERPDKPEWGFYPQVSEDGSLLVIHISESTEERNRIYLKDLRNAASPIIPFLDDFDAGYNFLGKEGDRLLFRTNLDAPRGRVLSIHLAQPDRKDWKELIPQSTEVMESVSWLAGKLVVSYQKDAHSVVRFFKLDGTPAGELALPGLGSVGGFWGRQDATETFYSYSAYTQPTTIYRLDLTTDTSTIYRKPEVAFNPDEYVTEQVFYASRDGTRVPMFISHRKDVVLGEGTHPTLLYGYGGFNISLTPYFSVSRLVWMEMGGVYAVANLRGGGEYGEEWHTAGIKKNKQNVFDDFIAAGEHLVKSGWTTAPQMAIEGGSNGGLLVGACLEQRPDLWGAAIPAVGVMDMLRYHKFTIGWAWAADYGTSDEAEMIPTLLAYSPVHNAKPGTYPPTLVTTADHDDRVVPAHSFKFAAAMQHAQAGQSPILIRIETRAGHGRGKPTAMRLDEAADVQAFLVKALGMELPAAWRQ